MSHTMLSYPNNPRAWKAIVAGKYAGVEIAYPDTFKIGTDNKTPEFLAKNPLGQVPVLETPSGPIWESNAIARYVARQNNSKLYGSSTYEAAQIDQWIDFCATNVDLPRDAWIFPIIKLVPNDEFAVLATTKAKETLKKTLRVLNNYLMTRTFLVGERVTLADIVVSLNLYRLYTMVFDPEYRKDFVNTNRWFQTCVNQPEFKSVIGETKLCETAQVAGPVVHHAEGEHAHGQQQQGGQGKGKKGKGEKQEKQPKQEKAPKQEKPKETHSEAEHGAEGGEDEEEEKEKEPKVKNPLDSLPPSKFVMDEWKRTYSNNDTKTVANPWFWEHFDPEGYSLWFADHKYPDELKKLFMTCNAVTGWMQRLDKLRKYGFGAILIFGQEPEQISISSCWLFRGKDIPAEMKECDDFELYKWTPVNLSDPAQKAKVNDYWAWEGEFDGRGKPKEGKTFK